MSLTPKQITPEHQTEMMRISEACQQTAQLDLEEAGQISQFLGNIHKIRLWLNDLHNDIVQEKR